jgi:hypothetical protein
VNLEQTLNAHAPNSFPRHRCIRVGKGVIERHGVHLPSPGNDRDSGMEEKAAWPSRLALDAHWTRLAACKNENTILLLLHLHLLQTNPHHANPLLPPAPPWGRMHRHSRGPPRGRAFGDRTIGIQDRS